MHLFGRLSRKSSNRQIHSSVESLGSMVNIQEVGPFFYLTYPRFPEKGSDPSDGLDRRVYVRQNIDEWSGKRSNKRQVDLFIMAMEKFQKLDPKDKISYFQIAGIHGQPFVRWDDNSREPMKNGYCFHAHILFPIWHRPYVLLFEQVVYDIMIRDVIPQFPKEEEAGWRELADSWRLPFWDWARNGRVPDLANEGVGTENTWADDAEQEEYKNFGNAIGTSRWPDEEDQKPTSEGWRHGVVNNRKVADAFSSHMGYNEKNHGASAEMVYRLLTIPMDFTTFASTNPTSKDQKVDEDLNIEYIHNNIHGWTGDAGHMGNVPVASFDPLFWLHHCNIDRIFALWQALNPDKFLDKIPPDNSKITDSHGQEHDVNKDTPLQPFRNDPRGNYWTPDGVRYTVNLGYTYPELQRWDTKYSQQDKTFNETLYVEDLTAQINRLYGVSRSLVLDPKTPAPDGVEHIDGGLKITDFGFSIRFLKYAFGGQPFWIKLYIAQEEGVQTPITDLIAEVYNFSQRPELDGSTVCGNCKNGQTVKIKSTAYIPITPVLYKLLKAGRKLKTLTRDEVLSFLRKRAYWRVVKHGKELPRYEVEKLDLEIIGSSNDTKFFENPALPPAFDNFKEEPTISGGADGALDPELKQPNIPIPYPRPVRLKANLPLHSNLEFQKQLKPDSVILLESDYVDLSKPAVGVDMTQISITDDAGNTVFHISIRRGQGQIIFNAKVKGSWGEEERINLDHRFRASEEGATILIHDQGDGYEVWIDWVHALWFAKRVKNAVPKAISYGLADENGTAVLADDIEVRTYPSMRALFLQKHEHEEEKHT
ncbi:hypothetical protein N7509_001555 [Penicillium cosmopolitanum]|uniref:tyrosinase n=1 Tax=Penicillium cosmopolitanum TaxID=1131564 RepID=A0A9W9W781_9EURO|nr:uncharacterized protein N7509_001555 [Penicillium cosmopolitanum]KAJ5407672.1 hypothetical protein N7509_001555 [Penicillium cosmopolitanum]